MNVGQGTVVQSAVEEQRTPAYSAWTILLLLLGLGAAVRVGTFLAVRSLWLDEAMLALNIGGRSMASLAGPLAHSQAAPWLFLWAEKLMVGAFGVNEMALRLVPLLCGILLPWLAWRVGRAVIPQPAGVLAAVALVVLSPLLIYYANEVKPYGPDAVATLAVLLSSVRVSEEPDSRRRWIVLVLTGVVAILGSFPSVFVLGGCWITLLAESRARGHREARRFLLVSAAAWGSAFAGPFLLVMRRAARDDFLQSFFADRFLVPWEPASLANVPGTWTELFGEAFLGHWLLAPGARWMAAALALLGAVTCLLGIREIYRARGGTAVALIISPIGLALLASALRLYPVSPRLWVFAVPLWALLLGAGAAPLMSVSAPASRAAGVRSFATATLVAMALAASAYDAAVALSRPYARRDHLRPFIESLREQQRLTREPVYVSARAVPQWLFYTTSWAGTDIPPEGTDASSEWLERRTCGSDRPASSEACQLLGKASNVRYSERQGFIGRADVSWAIPELARLRQYAAPCGWVLLFLPYAGEPAALAVAMEHAHGSVERVVAARPGESGGAATRAFHVCFGATP